ncbi:MAG TPA: MBL fold metallo-hydrolase [Phycisphaerae bacterium]|nr:MBL fold metallo-hydrolase [Phycisphaerae bacterium]
MRIGCTTNLFPTPRRTFIAALIVQAVLCLSGCEEPESSRTSFVNKGEVTVTIVYDNNPGRKDLTSAWGFACIIQGPGKTILFDTGSDGRILLENMRRLNIDPQEIDVVVLSHIHLDHTGGVVRLLKTRPNIPVYVPTAFPPAFKEQLQTLSGSLIEAEKSETICRGVRTTGTLGKGTVEEQGLCVNTPEGWVLITSCAHPGVANMVALAGEVTKDPINLVMGGFHMGSQSEATINAEMGRLQELGVGDIVLYNCSGGPARRLFKGRFGDRCILAGVGSAFPFHAKK